MQTSLRERWEKEGAAEKRGRPLGPTSREGFLSSASSCRRRSCSSMSAAAAAALGADFLGSGLKGGVGFGGLEEATNDVIWG